MALAQGAIRFAAHAAIKHKLDVLNGTGILWDARRGLVGSDSSHPAVCQDQEKRLARPRGLC